MTEQKRSTTPCGDEATKLANEIAEIAVALSSTNHLRGTQLHGLASRVAALREHASESKDKNCPRCGYPEDK